jgi:hypothetical protein
MNAKYLENTLIDFTVRHSQYDEHRNYVGMSQILRSESEILDNFRHGTPADDAARLKCYKGYQMERDLVTRCRAIWKNRITFRELEAYNGWVKGNPDFFFDESPCDCKSVLLDTHIPARNKIPQRSYWQMQAYLLFSQVNRGFLIYESRETGKIVVHTVYENSNIQAEIKLKLQRIVETLQSERLE